MSEAFAYVGGLLLAVATIPQVREIARTRSARGIAGGFAALNLVGILLLLARAAEIREWSFVAVNGATATFWMGVILVKVAEAGAREGPAREAKRPSTGVAGPFSTEAAPELHAKSP